ncbi:unnamed protein product [Rhodiola kirilowii]
MASSEPTLVPEWLRCNGHGNSGGSAAHHFASANSHSDTPLVANSARNRSSRTISDIDNPRALLDRSSSNNSRRSSSNNGSSKHPYSNFSRSHRDKERENERSGFGDFWERDSFDPLGKESLRRTRSMVSRKQGDSFGRTFASDSKTIESNNHLQRNGLATRDKLASSVPKVSFEKDFPYLGADEKQVSNLVRVVSPGLTMAAQGLPIGSSALIGEGWSALADVPVVTGSNNNAQSIHQPLATVAASNTISGVRNTVSESSNISSGVSNTASGDPKATSASGPSSGLNMAEALVQPPPVTCSAPQLSVETQRLELLAIKKVRQLIPVTPAVPKALSSSDKVKPKINARFGDVSGANKVGQQPPSSSMSVVGNSSRGGAVTFDASKQPHCSKLFILKPPWENGASASSKDGSNHENSAGGRPTTSMLASPVVSSTPARSPNSSKASFMVRKPSVSNLTLASSVEKRPLSSYAKSRSEFFNSVRKKTSMTTSVTSETSNSILSPSEDKPCAILNEMTSESPCRTENGGLTRKEDFSNEDQKFVNGEKNSTSCAEVIPDEEEAFLRSLGWEENGEEEEEGLTEEEINAFFQEVMKARPSLNLSHGVHPALSILMESHASNVGVASPRVSSSDAALKFCL